VKQRISRILFKVEQFIKRFITANFKRNFICDGKIPLCLTCSRVRTILRERKVPKRIAIMAKYGTYVWAKTREELVMPDGSYVTIEQKVTTLMRGQGNMTNLYGCCARCTTKSVLHRDLAMVHVQEFRFGKPKFGGPPSKNG
jgi:hypothetical protein